MLSPKIDREFTILRAEHTSPLTRNRYTRDGYTARCATQFIEKPGMTYAEAVSLLPAGYRMSCLDEIAYLTQREAELKAGGLNPRDALQDPLFARQIGGNPYRWNWTHIALRAPAGKETFPIDVINGRKYGRGDYLRGEKVIAEGIKIPVSQGSKIVAIDPVLLIPIEVSEGDEPQHTLHWYFDPGNYNEKKEVAVRLDGVWYCDELDGCLRLNADVGRSFSLSLASFRLFQGLLDEVPLPKAA